MKEHIETITSEFVDYKGEKHYFIIAAISQNFPKFLNIDKNSNNVKIGNDRTPVFYEVNEYIEGYGTTEYNISITKNLRIGISICNPVDKFNESIGKAKAIARARMSDPVLFVKNAGLINSKVVRALLEQESEYLKNNPELLIKGYKESKLRYERNHQMVNLEKSFTPVERDIAEKLTKNPNFLDKVYDYIEWFKNKMSNK